MQLPEELAEPASKRHVYQLPSPSQLASEMARHAESARQALCAAARLLCLEITSPALSEQ